MPDLSFLPPKSVRNYALVLRVFWHGVKRSRIGKKYGSHVFDEKPLTIKTVSFTIGVVKNYKQKRGTTK